MHSLADMHAEWLDDQIYMLREGEVQKKHYRANQSENRRITLANSVLKNLSVGID